MLRRTWGNLKSGLMPLTVIADVPGGKFFGGLFGSPVNVTFDALRFVISMPVLP